MKTKHFYHMPCNTLQRIVIKIMKISPYNHGSSKEETHIRTVSEIIATQLTDTGQIWAYSLQTYIFP